jgi:hypothetical protein
MAVARGQGAVFLPLFFTEAVAREFMSFGNSWVVRAGRRP